MGYIVKMAKVRWYSLPCVFKTEKEAEAHINGVLSLYHPNIRFRIEHEDKVLKEIMVQP